MNRLDVRDAVPGARPEEAHPRATLSIASLGTFVALVAYTGPLGNLPTVAHALGAGPTGQTWILSSISVALAASLLTVGTLADRHGRRRAFVLGCLVLALGSVLCAAAQGTPAFIVGRLVQGVGSAAVIAASLGLIGSVFTTPDQRARASAAWGASVGAGIAIGPVATGLLDLADAWRWMYVVLAAGTLLLAGAGRGRLPESRSPAPRPLDIPGAVTLSGAIVLALVALVEGRHGVDPVVAVVTAGAGLLAAVFVVVERRAEHPVLELAFFRQAPFTAATLAALATGVSVIGLMSYACTFLVGTMETTTLGAAAVLFAWSGTSAVSASLARRLPPALAGSRQLVVGLLGVSVGELALLGASPGSIERLIPGLVLAGVASGVLNAGLGRQAVATVPADRASFGSGANNTARYLGSAVGVTIVVVIATSPGASADARVAGWDHAVLASAIMAAVSAVAVLVLHGRGVRPAGAGGVER
ncbi:MFS transporter [Nocardioides halotolerans]|uniref:MFS transporter n=1 Tax=Nocardioides halotolerans TaxID=433660 RepID=UPI001FE09254|nr:MFS transporter [Nocardioides halotolerans]